MTLGESCRCLKSWCSFVNTEHRKPRHSKIVLFFVCWTSGEGEITTTQVVWGLLLTMPFQFCMCGWWETETETSALDQVLQVLPGSLSDMLLWLFLCSCLRDVGLQSVQEDRDRGRGLHATQPKLLISLSNCTDIVENLLNLLRPVSKTLTVFDKFQRTSCGICGVVLTVAFVTPRSCSVELCGTLLKYEHELWGLDFGRCAMALHVATRCLSSFLRHRHVGSWDLAAHAWVWTL